MKGFLNSINKIPPKVLKITSISVLIVVFLALLISNSYLIIEINKARLLDNPVGKITFYDYPRLKNFYDPQVSARGLLVMDADSGVILYEKNSSLRFSTASTAKIMTALTALESYDLNDVLTVKTATDEGALIGLTVGEKITFESLLYAMLLPSGNDAALTIAQNYKDGQDKFIEKMNKNAQKWNLPNTHFVDPAGLIDEGDYTTPRELARLAIIALENPVLTKIVSTKSKVFTSIDGQYAYYVDNLNKLLGINGINGVKTGFTNGAGQVLVSSKLEPAYTYNGEKQRKIIMVVMDSKDRFDDTLRIANLVSGNINYLSIRP